MFDINRFKIFTCITASVSAILILTPSLYSESFFMKDGSIVEGAIISEDDTRILLKNSAGSNIEILRKNTTRALYHRRYKNKKYLTKTDGTTIEGYIVNEDNESYIFRSKLDSPEEIKISRDEVETLSAKKPSERKAALYSSVFINDGRIIDCRIVKESGNDILIKPVNGEAEKILKKDILRIHYNNNFRDKKIFNKTDGTKAEGYIMDEDYNSYIYRTDINSPVEIKIYKDQLKNISRK